MITHSLARTTPVSNIFLHGSKGVRSTLLVKPPNPYFCNIVGSMCEHVGVKRGAKVILQHVLSCPSCAAKSFFFHYFILSFNPFSDYIFLFLSFLRPADVSKPDMWRGLGWLGVGELGSSLFSHIFMAVVRRWKTEDQLI